MLKPLAFAAAFLASTAAFAQAPDPLAKIGHIVVIFDENRSFDSMFGRFPGANGLANAGDRTHNSPGSPMALSSRAPHSISIPRATGST